VFIDGEKDTTNPAGRINRTPPNYTMAGGWWGGGAVSTGGNQEQKKLI